MRTTIHVRCGHSGKPIELGAGLRNKAGKVGSWCPARCEGAVVSDTWNTNQCCALPCAPSGSLRNGGLLAELADGFAPCVAGRTDGWEAS